MHKQLHCALLVGFLVMAIGGAAVGTEPQLAPLRPAWHCLPAETVLAARMGSGQTIVDALRTRTQLGALLLSQERIDQLIDLIRRHDDDNEMDDLAEEIAPYGLAPADLPRFLAGESGYALALIRRAQVKPLLVGIGWLEPGPDLAGRAVAAVAQAVQEHEDLPHAVERIDLQIGGHTVMHLTIPEPGPCDEGDDVEEPDDLDPFNEFERDEPFELAEPHLAEQVHVLLTRMEGRLLVVHTFAAPAKILGLERKGHLEQGADLEQVTRLCADFLAAHHRADGGFAAHIEAADGVAEALPAGGLSIVEMFGDLSSLIELARKDENAARVLDTLGLDRIGVVALRIALSDTTLRSGQFMAAPQPRRGLLALLDQPDGPVAPPAWVPANVVSYSQVSFDLGRAYQQIKAMILASFPQASGPFQNVEQRVHTFAQAELAAILSSLGNQHTVMTFEPHVRPLVSDEPLSQMPLDRVAIVWQVTDEPLWQRILQGLAAFAAASNGVLVHTDEQGFGGWRFQQGGHSGGLMLGKGYLVLAIGPDLIANTLSVLNHPPDGPAALRNSPSFAAVMASIEARPGLMVQYADGKRYARSLWHIANALIGMIPTRADAPDVAEDLKKVLPDAEQFEHILGPMGGFTLVNDQGVVSRSMAELPPPQ